MIVCCKLIGSLPTKLAVLMGSLLAHARSVSLMIDSIKKVVPYVQAMVRTFVMKSFEYTEHVLFKML